MNKEEALQGFLRYLRILFNNSLAYPRSHPYFIKSVEEFRLKAEELFGFVSPIRINISPDSFFIDGRQWNAPGLYAELAQFIHQRKIKSIELKPGVTTDELANFFSGLALSAKDIIRKGGLKKLLEENNSLHIFVEELDYQSLLSAQGSEAPKDLWSFIFNKDYIAGDSRRVEEIVENFAQELQKIGLKDVITDDKVREGLNSFLSWLKRNNEHKYLKCLGEIFEYSHKDKEDCPKESQECFKQFFEGFDERDLSDMAAQQLTKDSCPDSMLVSLFSLISQFKNSSGVALSLEQSIREKAHLKDRDFIARRIQSILSHPKADCVSFAYQSMLSSLLKEISFREEIPFDSDGLLLNFCYVLLNVLSQEEEGARIKVILKKIGKELPFIYGKRDYKYLASLVSVLSDRRADKPELTGEIERLRGEVFFLLEEMIWNLGLDYEIEPLIKLLDKSRKDERYYLDNIFQGKKINPFALHIFVKFFPEGLSSFYAALEENSRDKEFLELVINSIMRLEDSLSRMMLKNIYYYSGEEIKGVILDSITESKKIDKDILFLALGEKNGALRRKALSVLTCDKAALEEGVKILLSVKSPFGRNNKVLLVNMGIIEELGVKEAINYLPYFTSLKLPWHKQLKDRAISLMGALK